MNDIKYEPVFGDQTWFDDGPDDAEMNTPISLPSDDLSQSRFKLGKYEYEAVPCTQIVAGTCYPCAFDKDNHKCINSPPCLGEERDDGQDVYFIEVVYTDF